MNEKILITKENYKDIFFSLTYGHKNVIYENENVHSLITTMIEVTNEFTGLNTLREVNDVIDISIDNEWVSTNIENSYRIIHASHGVSIPVLHDDNYEIECLAMLSKKNGIVSVINNFEKSLTRYAKRIASKHDVKFTGHGFNGAMKALSVRKQIEEAFLEGKYNISFSSDLFNVQTIRNHASVYGSLIGEKLKVEISKGLITVHFKELDELTLLFNSARDIFDKIGLKAGEKERNEFFHKLLDFNVNDKTTVNNQNITKIIDKYKPLMIDNEKPIEIPKFVPKLYGKEVSLEEYKNAENWQRSGFASKYNWENDIKGDIDMYPKDARFDDSDDDEDQEPAKYNWDDDKDEF